LAEVDMRTEIPAGTLELFTVPGLRPDKALKLYKELGISSVEDLERAAKQERLKDVNGLGSALQSKILQGIEIAVEINANPWRLDLDWRWHRQALELGCLTTINPDAHSTDEIDLTHWGVEMARKGGVPKERVLNCLEMPDFAALLKDRTRRRGAEKDNALVT
jgi:helix-hairpin-helix protein